MMDETSTAHQGELYIQNMELMDRLEYSFNEFDPKLFDKDVSEISEEYMESRLDNGDYLMVVIAGVIGGAFSSSEDITDFLADFHDSAASGRSFLNKQLKHVGDLMDKVEGEGIVRNAAGDKPPVPFHRFFWGHDPLSFEFGGDYPYISPSDDNPFSLLKKQYGTIRGPYKTAKHLIADTFSRQGLPLPGHSYFDYQYFNDNAQKMKTANRLIGWTREIAKGSAINPGEAINHLFTLRAQDIASQGLTWAICFSYIKYRGITDEIKKSQLKLMAYAISFYTNFFVGMYKTGGVPYINWPTLSLLIKESFSFYMINKKEIRDLEKNIDIIVSERILLEARVKDDGEGIILDATDVDIIRRDREAEKNFKRMSILFEEEV